MGPKAQVQMQVLDKGFVELLGTFGDDLTVVNAARVSYNKEVTVMDPKDAKLIKYLAEHNHVTPFFHPQIRLRLKMPIFVAREWYRHQIGFARNEVSRRYVDYKAEMYLPDSVRERDAKLKQGSKGSPVADNSTATALIDEINQKAEETYEQLLAMNVAPEVARTVLPQGMYTEFIETGSLAAYARLCGLRLDPSAQWEIRQYAAAVSELLQEKFPVSWPALTPAWGVPSASPVVPVTVFGNDSSPAPVVPVPVTVFGNDALPVPATPQVFDLGC